MYSFTTLAHPEEVTSIMEKSFGRFLFAASSESQYLETTTFSDPQCPLTRRWIPSSHPRYFQMFKSLVSLTWIMLDLPTAPLPTITTFTDNSMSSSRRSVMYIANTWSLQSPPDKNFQIGSLFWASPRLSKKENLN